MILTRGTPGARMDGEEAEQLPLNNGRPQGDNRVQEHADEDHGGHEDPDVIMMRLGKPSNTNSAVVLNIVQTTLDPPPSFWTCMLQIFLTNF